MTPPRILQEEFPFINPVDITAAYIAVVFTGEPIIVEAIIAVWPLAWRYATRWVLLLSALALPEHITHRAADTILTARATDWPLSSVRETKSAGPKPVPLARNMHVNRDLGG
jgi:hypothetical protein